MLKGIDSLLSPELLKILMEMGHGDEIVIGDGNFPAASVANNLARLDGHSVPEVLEAVLKLFPLDGYAEYPIALMAVCGGDDENQNPPVWEKYKEIIAKYEPEAKIEYVERFAYYERAKKAYAVVATGEKSKYANIILKKGCV